ncbi:hypothetical protein F2Q70_00009233 [Brassica cretica]|nr:hypothetical protein F2Q70_00009233 [Brassica cretica]
MAELIKNPESMKRAQHELDEVVGKDNIVEESHITKLPYIVRDPNVWENPNEFHPERFLDKSCDFHGTDYSFLPFGSGRRICVGLALAERMVQYTLATLLHSFDWKIPEGHVFNVEDEFGIVLKLKNPLIAMPVSRLSDPNLYL